MNPILYNNHKEALRSTKTISMYVRKAGLLALPVEELIFIQATSNYSWLHWKDGQRMLMPRTLKYYEPDLPDSLFVRLHRNSIVNMKYVDRLVQIDPDKGGLAYLKTGVVLPVSRRRWYVVKRMLAQCRKNSIDLD